MVCLNLSRSYREMNYESEPQDGSKLYVHKEGSDVLAPIFSDSGLTRMQQNPIIADENGEFDACYLMDGSYRIVIRDAKGHILREQDEVIIRSDVNQRVVTEFSSVTEMVADRLYSHTARQLPFRLTEGDIVKAGGESFPYRVANPAATDHHLETLGGVKLYALRSEHGKITARQLGIGSADDSVQFARLMDCLAQDFCRHVVIDVDVNLPGINNGFSLTGAQLPYPAVIEFTSDARVIYDSDGTQPHDYIVLNGVSNLTLIRPSVQGSIAPINRTARPAIHFLDCDDCHTIDANVVDVHGAGILMESSRDCTHTRPRVYRSLADGLHITNGSNSGPCVNCWTYNAYTEDTGDDGVAIVSYNTGSDPCRDCGHLDFVVKRSNARGGAIVGGIGCTLRGEVHDCQYQGIILARDDTFNSYPGTDCSIDVTATNCGLLNGAPNVEIGRASIGVSGTIRSRDAQGRGVQIAHGSEAPENVSVDIYERDSGGTAVYCDNVEGLSLGTVHSIRAGREALAIVGCSDVVVTSVNLREYGQTANAVDGLFINNTTNFMIGAGLISDSTANSERPVDIMNSHNGQILPLVVSGGFAAIPIRSQGSNSNVTLPQVSGFLSFNPPSIPPGSSSVVGVPVPGTVAGDPVSSVTFSESLQGILMSAQFLSNGTATVRFTNPTPSAIDLPSGTISVIADRRAS